MVHGRYQQAPTRAARNGPLGRMQDVIGSGSQLMQKLE